LPSTIGGGGGVIDAWLACAGVAAACVVGCATSFLLHADKARAAKTKAIVVSFIGYLPSHGQQFVIDRQRAHAHAGGRKDGVAYGWHCRRQGRFAEPGGRIVRTLLRYSRQEPSEKQACSINDVVDQALDLARPYGTSHGADLRLELAPAIPLVPMNPLEIELVLVNLIRNAIEAGGGNVVVSVGTMQTAGGVRVAVSDSGCGMTEEQVAHVFDPLFTTRRHLGGSGLGMSIALGIVKGHEGRMEVASQEGKGTTVTIDLPVAACPLELGGNQGQDNHGSDSGCGG